MPNTPERAKFWADFICRRCQFPAPERLRQQFAHSHFSDFCECGCNSFKVEVSPNSEVQPIARQGKYGLVFEADFRLREEGKTLEILLFAGKNGHLKYVEIDCCGNSVPIPDAVEVQGPPVNAYTGALLFF